MEGTHPSENAINPQSKNEDTDFFDHEPSKTEKAEMRRASKTPSEWLQLLCQKWAVENEVIMSKVDQKFLQYKSFMKGKLSSQLLCRLSILASEFDPISAGDGSNQNKPLVFWAILGVDDEFDRNYIVAQVEKFCSLYNIRGNNAFIDEETLALAEPSVGVALGGGGISSHIDDPTGGITVGLSFPPAINHTAISGIDPTAAAAAVAAATTAAYSSVENKTVKKQQAEVNRARRKAKNAERALETERRLSMKREQQRLQIERRTLKMRERDASNVRKAAEKAAKDATREEKRRRKLEVRARREQIAQEQKEAALRRAAELVQSNRVPIEITRGAAAASAAAIDFVGSPNKIELTPKRSRSSIVVSTASDLHQIVTHSKNLWTKYNAIAKEHNQKVNWITVAKELGIHVKVREKYARMHARAEQRGFDFVACGHYKIKEHPHIFLLPLSPGGSSSRKSHDDSRSVSSTNSEKQLQGLNNDEIARQQVEIEQAAAAAAAAAMKANGVKAEELIDASVVAQIENPDFESVAQGKTLVETIDTTSAPMMDESVLDQLTMKSSSTDSTQKEEASIPKIEISV